MRKIQIDVAKDVEYISDWTDYELPKEHCVVDKGVTGCGYTEFCLTNGNNVVLCSPRKLLLENKRDQHTTDTNIFYFENKLSNYEDVQEMELAMNEHLMRCWSSKLPIKFMVTYDSTYLLINFLRKHNLLPNFTFVVDEFQSVFLDSYFKSEIENDFIEYLQECPNVIYLSATPMLDKYLDKMPTFKDLPFYQLNWDNSRYTEKIRIKRKHVTSLGHECKLIIERYRRGEFENELDINGNLVQSREAVFYFNSLTDIIRIINNTGLKPDEADIICADTEENRVKLKKLKFSVSRVPLRHEPRKMFTFCTRSVYMGADFYSDCASTFIFADPNLKSLALDISLDLPQIVGRQRLKENPFKNNIIIFYKTIRDENIENYQEFQKIQEERKAASKDVLALFDKASPSEKKVFINKIVSDIQVSQYSGDFISMSKKTNTPVYNNFIEIANERAWEVAQVDYQNSITVTRALSDRFDSDEYKDKMDSIVSDFLDNHFYSTNVFEKKMKMYCEFMDKYKDDSVIVHILSYKIPDQKYKKYYDVFGTAECKSVLFREKALKQRLNDVFSKESVRTKIIDTFIVGENYSYRQIKDGLKTIYQEENFSRTPKATDIEEYLEVSVVNYRDPDTKKRSKGYRIIGIKS